MTDGRIGSRAKYKRLTLTGGAFVDKLGFVPIISRLSYCAVITGGYQELSKRLKGRVNNLSHIHPGTPSAWFSP